MGQDLGASSVWSQRYLPAPHTPMSPLRLPTAHTNRPPMPDLSSQLAKMSKRHGSLFTTIDTKAREARETNVKLIVEDRITRKGTWSCAFCG
jgi:hypothetical protein